MASLEITTKSPQLISWRFSGAKHCFIIKEGPLINELTKIYGRPIGLKIFDVASVSSLEDLYKVKWGDDPKEGEPRKNTTLWEATQIQNICAFSGLSSRVYGLITVGVGNKLCPAQVIELLPNVVAIKQADVHVVIDQIIQFGKTHGFGLKKKDFSRQDVISGKLIDFQVFAFTDSYKDMVKRIYIKKGNYGKTYYQDILELGLSEGPRKSLDRVRYLQLDKIDFKGKIVWDLGCAGGFFTRYAVDRGAKTVIGVDMKESIEAAFHVANWLGYFNIDYVIADLNQGVPESLPKPDIVFFLSMNLHIPIPERLFEADTVIFEDNGEETRKLEQLTEPWTTHFSKIEFVGRAEDHGMKSLFHLRK